MGTQIAQWRNNLTLPFLATLLFLQLLTAVGYSSKAKRPTLDIDGRYTIPDSIIAGQPFSVKFEFEMLDTVPRHTDYPDKAWIWFQEGYTLLGGSTTWEGSLERGSKVTIEFSAVYPENAMSTGILFGAHITTGRHARDRGAVFPYTDNYIRSEVIKLIGEEPIDPLDTMTLNGKPMPDDMKAAMRAMIQPRRGRRVGRVCVTLSDPDSIAADGVLCLGRYTFPASSTSESASSICFRWGSEDMERVLPSELDFSVDGLDLELRADSTFHINFDAPVDTCTIEFTYDGETYRILLTRVD
ncbi:MAG: hypothetical protein ABIJ61_07790 [bacterium]